MVTVTRAAEQNTLIECEVSGGFNFSFPGAYEDPAAVLDNGWLVRNQDIAYKVDGDTEGDNTVGGEHGTQLGRLAKQRRIIVRLTDTTNDALVFFDSGKGSYQVVDL